MKQKYWIYMLLIALSFKAVGQTENSSQSTSTRWPLNIKASYNLGFMMAHRIPMQHIPNSYAQGVEISVEKQGENKKDWEKLYNSPTFGLAFLATSTGNTEIMGMGYGLNWYILVPIVTSKNFRLQTSWGYGLGYLSKKFDPMTNYRNNAIGSNLNLFAAIKLIGEINLSKQLSATLGASFHHWSNAAFKYPNLGLNVPNVNLGLKYEIRNERQYPKLSKQEQKALFPPEKNEVTVITNIGFKAYNIDDNSTYPAYTLEVNYARLWSAKWKVTGGVDVFYNTAYKREIELSSDSTLRNNTALQSGLNLAYHQTFGGFSIMLGMGTYVFDQTLQNELFYHRFGTRFCINNRIIISTVLHTHWARADHFKIGIGYKFRK